MSLQGILDHRHAIRHFDPVRPLDTARIRHCLELAALAPTSSNMQLWECYHVTQPKIPKKLTHALLDQQTARIAQQTVVFITRKDKHRAHTKAVRALEIENVMQNSPKEEQARCIKRWQVYCDFVMPLFYTRFFWLLGLFRKLLAQIIGLFRPIMKQVTKSDTRITVHKSCALIVQAFMLTMNEEGYDTCPVKGFDSWLVKKALGPPYHTEINMVITYGMRLPNGVRSERYRPPFEQMYHQV